MGLDDDTVGWLENKGFESPQAAITSQRELEKKLGGPPEMLQKWPESDDTDGFKAIHQRLGMPEDVAGYKLEFEEGAPIDADTLTWFKEKAFGQNMTNDQVQGMALAWNAEVARVQEEQQQALDVRNQTQETELRNAWGTKYDERLDYGNRALLASGLEDADIAQLESVLGPKKLAEWAARMADTMGEDTIAEHTATPAYGTTKEQVQNQINELVTELGEDKARYDKYFADHKVPDDLRETTGKDFRRMQQLEEQLAAMNKSES